MMDSRFSVSGRRALEEDELRGAFPHLEGFLEGFVFLPPVQHLIPDRNQI